MTLFGNKATFAIEALIEPHLTPPSAPWGRMCIWCEGISIGDIQEEHCGLGAFDDFTSLAKRLDNLWLPEFDGMTDLELWNHLDALLYGYHGDIELVDSRTLKEIEADSAKYWIFNFLTNWGEQFDRGGKSFIFQHPKGHIKILNRHLPDSRGICLSTSRDAFCAAISEATAWFNQKRIELQGTK